MQEKNMIFLKKKHVILKQGGGGGVPHLGKITTFSRYFFWGASLNTQFRGADCRQRSAIQTFVLEANDRHISLGIAYRALLLCPMVTLLGARCHCK